MTISSEEGTLPTGRVSAFWQTSRCSISLTRPLVMGILNVTPDSFSDGGKYLDPDEALRRAGQMIDEGADIIDIGGESTRPGSEKLDPSDELRRVLPAVEAISKRFDTPISIDTTKWLVAKAAIDHGAEIINDISGLRWDERLANVAAATGAGLILMHSRGSFETMHSQPAVDDIFAEVKNGLADSIAIAKKGGVSYQQIVLDIGIGFGKKPEQNLELIENLDKIVGEFKSFPIMAGISRKSFIGRMFGGAPPEQRIAASVELAVTAIKNGAWIVRVHDVKETVAAIKADSEVSKCKI